MTKEQIKALIEEAENQILLAKDSINAGDWDKASVRLQKVMEKASLIELNTKVLEGRKRSQDAETKLTQERAK
jgi:hypothetical protein